MLIYIKFCPNEAACCLMTFCFSTLEMTVYRCLCGTMCYRKSKGGDFNGFMKFFLYTISSKFFKIVNLQFTNSTFKLNRFLTAAVKGYL